MKRLAIVTGVMVLAPSLAVAQTATWTSDPTQGEVDFAITRMNISRVHGRFGNVAATIQYDQSDTTKSSVRVRIDTYTVDTGVLSRDPDHKGNKYLDVASFPKATFTSTSVARSGSDLTVTGNLPLNGVTKRVVLDVEGPTLSLRDRRNKVHYGFSATATISRTAFGIAPNTPASTVGDEVKLTIEVDAVEQ